MRKGSVVSEQSQDPRKEVAREEVASVLLEKKNKSVV